VPRIVDHDEKRREILDSVLPLLSASGYAAVGVRELAEAAGISRSALYHYFPSKAALFAALIERMAQRDLDALGEVTASSRAEGLATLFAVTREGRGFVEQQLRLLLEAPRHAPGLVPRIRELTDAYAPRIARYLSCGTAEAEQLFAALNGLVLTSMITGEEPDWDEAFATWCGLLGA